MNAAKKPVCLNSVNVCNWDRNAGPVVILNEQSSIHERVSFCWDQLDMVTGLLDTLGNHNDDEIRWLAGMLENLISPVFRVLETVGDMTQPTETT